MPRTILVGLFVVILVVMGACNTVPASDRSPELESPTGIIANSPVDSPVPEAASIVQTALSRDLNLPMDDIVLQNVEAVEWGDACLGLAQPDEMCAQMITPGYRMVFSTPQGERVVHSDRTGQLFRYVP